MRGTQWLLLVGIAGAFSGCSAMKDRLRGMNGTPIPPPDAYRDPVMGNGAYQRVLALPLLPENGQASSTDVVSSAIRDEMLKLRRFDVVTANPSDSVLKPEQGPKMTGRINVATMIDLGRRYGVDAVLFGAVDHYRVYDPPALGMSLSLVEVETGKILWHVRDFVDAADHDTSLAMRYFYEDEAAESEMVFEYDVMSTAPQWFARFAARRVTATLLPPPPLPGT